MALTGEAGTARVPASPEHGSVTADPTCVPPPTNPA